MSKKLKNLIVPDNRVRGLELWQPSSFQHEVETVKRGDPQPRDLRDWASEPVD